MVKKTIFKSIRRFPLSIFPATAFLLVLFIAPFITLIFYSLLTIEKGNVVGGPSLDSYIQLLGDPFTYYIFGRTIWLSLEVVLFCLLLGYPLAYAATRNQISGNKIDHHGLYCSTFVNQFIGAYLWLDCDPG